MPRLPTILVMGSQVISVSSGAASVVIASPRLLVAGAEFGALHAPLRFLVRGLGGEIAQAADHRAVHAARGRRHGRARRLVHERHELVREAGHRAGDADTAHVPAAAPPACGHPPTPLTQPRLGTLHLTTGPQQPSLTRHLAEPYSEAKSPSS